MMESPTNKKQYQRVSNNAINNNNSDDEDANPYSGTSVGNVPTSNFKDNVNPYDRNRMELSNNNTSDNLEQIQRTTMILSPNRKQKEHHSILLRSSSNDDDTVDVISSNCSSSSVDDDDDDNNSNFETSSLVDDSITSRQQRVRISGLFRPNNTLGNKPMNGSNHDRNSGASNFQDHPLHTINRNISTAQSNPRHQPIEIVGSTRSSLIGGSNHKTAYQPRYQDNPTPAVNSNTADTDDNFSDNDTIGSAAGTKSPITPGSPLHSQTKRILRSNRSSISSVGGGDDKLASPSAANVEIDSADEWDIDDEDEAGLRRYNQYYLEYAKPSDIPLPAEFSQPTTITEWVYQGIHKLWNQFLALRTAARQRRAARLLTMPSESFRYQIHACFLTWCCDATDGGIMLLVMGLLFWIVVGTVCNMGSKWWTYGFLLFLIRITARRTVEACMQQSQRNGGFRNIWLLLIGTGMGRTRVSSIDTDSVITMTGRSVTISSNGNNNMVRAQRL